MDIALGTENEGLRTVYQAAEFLKIRPYTVRVWESKAMQDVVAHLPRPLVFMPELSDQSLTFCG